MHKFLIQVLLTVVSASAFAQTKQISEVRITSTDARERSVLIADKVDKESWRFLTCADAAMNKADCQTLGNRDYTEKDLKNIAAKYFRADWLNTVSDSLPLVIAFFCVVVGVGALFTAAAPAGIVFLLVSATFGVFSGLPSEHLLATDLKQTSTAQAATQFVKMVETASTGSNTDSMSFVVPVSVEREIIPSLESALKSAE